MESSEWRVQLPAFCEWPVTETLAGGGENIPPDGKRFEKKICRFSRAVYGRGGRHGLLGH